MGVYDKKQKEGKLKRSLRKVGKLGKERLQKSEKYLVSKARKRMEKIKEENRLYKEEYERVKKKERMKFIRRKARKDAMGIFSNLGRADPDLNSNVGQILGFNFPKTKKKRRKKKGTKRRPKRIEYF